MLRLHYAVVLCFLLVTAPAWTQETLTPNGTQSSDSETSCDATVHTTVDDDPDAPGGDWCTADVASGSSASTWDFTLNMTDPTITLDNATDAQAIEVYVRKAATGGGNPNIRIDIYDGTSCADLHETGTENSVTNDAGEKFTDNWTSSGISAEADVCVSVTCTRSGGAPSGRRSCDIDAVEWDAAESSGRTRRVVSWSP